VQPAPGETAPSARTRWRRLAVGALAALAVLLLTFRHELSTRLEEYFQPSLVPVAAAGHGPIVAIPAMHDADSDANSVQFEQGFTQQLVSDLVRFDNLRVIAPSGAKEYDDGVNTLKNLRDRLGVDYVLQGSQARTTDALRLALELTDTRTSQVVWAESFQPKLTPDDLSTAVKDISSKVAASIGSRYGVVLHSEALLAQPSPPKQFSSYDCVLQYYALVIAPSPSRHLQVRSCLEQTVKDEPSYATAWAVLANVYAQEYRFKLNARPDPAESLRLSLEAARRAVLLEPENPTARIMLALSAFDRHDLDEFRRNGDLAVSYNPNDPDILGQYGLRLAYIGDWDRGEAMMRKAMELNPAHPVWYREPIAFIRYQQGKYPQALEEIDKYAYSNPSFLWYQVFLAMTFGQMGRATDAAAARDAILRIRPDFREAFWPMAQVWNAPDQQIANMAAGLHKAGLDVIAPNDNAKPPLQ
jgi:adenylate cyclase